MKCNHEFINFLTPQGAQYTCRICEKEIDEEFYLMWKDRVELIELAWNALSAGDNGEKLDIIEILEGIEERSK